MAYDDWVAASQEWLNDTYTGTSGYLPVDVNGLTGWPTMFALTRALQIELGISTPSDTFGPATLSGLVVHYAEVTANTANANVIAILQCAFWCKGYAGGSTFGTWSPAVEGSAVAVRAAMGLPVQLIGKITPKMFKSLLTMDAYVRIGSGTNEARSVQQWLNGRYENKAEYFLMPCDGIYSRDVQRGLMLAIQYEVLPSSTTPNGALGPSTKAGIETYGLFPNYATTPTSDGTGRPMRRLFQAALIFNRYLAPFDGNYAAATNAKQQNFQNFAALPMTSSANYATWASLLVSTGDPSRPGTAADTSTPLDAAKAASLYNAGYRTVGRYLTATGKRVQPGELSTIFNAGLTMFPIYQEWNNAAVYFSYAIGKSQGILAARRARQLGFKADTIIHFSVDYDPTGDEITALIIPFFEGVRDGLATSLAVQYRVGVYGTRNTCTRVSAAGLAVSSFVAGMSTGWSGNLGFPLPSNWAYDQILGITIGSGTAAVPIDKNIKSSSASPVSSSGLWTTPYVVKDADLTSFFWRMTTLCHLAEIEVSQSPLLDFMDGTDFVLYAIQTKNGEYMGIEWDTMAPLPELHAPPEFAAALATARASFAAAAVSSIGPSDWIDFFQSSGLGADDFDHFAASTRGYLASPLPLQLDYVSPRDMPAWGGDYASAWVDYETARLDGYSGGAFVWARDSFFTAASPSFVLSDLKADVDAYLTAKRLIDSPGRPVSDVLRELRVLSTGAAWRYSQFYAERFGGSLTNLSSAVRSVFQTQDPAIAGIVAIGLDGTRGPGNFFDYDPTAPPPAERLTEAADFAAGFVEAFVARMSL